MSADFDRDQLLDIFVAEAGDDMARFWQALHPEDHGTPGPADVADLHTVGHKLKGAALLYGFPGLGQLGALLEETLERVGEISRRNGLLLLKSCARLSSPFERKLRRSGVGEARTRLSLKGSFVAVPSSCRPSLIRWCLSRPSPQLRLLTIISFRSSTARSCRIFPPKRKNISTLSRLFSGVWREIWRMPTRFINCIESHTR